MAFELKDNEKVVLTAVATDVNGNPTAATLAFTSGDEAIVSLVDNGDGTAVASAAGLGLVTVTAVATDPDGTQVSGTLDIEVTAHFEHTVSVTITPGVPELQ